jgi:hypothetical protein
MAAMLRAEPPVVASRDHARLLKNDAMLRARAALTVVAVALAYARPARGQPEVPADYATKRYEQAALPLVAGSSDIGLQLGAVGSLTYYRDGIRPYRWKMDLLGSVSFLKGPTAIEVAQQNYLWAFDLAGIAGGLIRSTTQVKFRRTGNLLYYGIGNASSAERPPAAVGEPKRHFQSISRELEVRQLTRIRLQSPIDAMITTTYRYVAPDTYEGSKLQEDAAAKEPDGSPRIFGTRPLSLLTIGAGLIYDTRDNEYFPVAGMLHKVGPKYVQGIPFSTDVRYGQASGFFAGYVPVIGPVVFAARVVVDAQFGNVPFFDLYRAGPFEQVEMIGGSTGIRGVPIGRHLGPIKALANQELRAMFVSFKLFQQSFRVGGNVLFDFGRLWSDYSFASPADGSGLGLKWGAGGGLYLQWGQASVFRVEAAYSPSAGEVNPGFPLGLYVNDGVAF